MLFEVESQIVFKLAFIGELAFWRGEFGTEDSSRTKTLCVCRLSKSAVCVLASILLFLFLPIPIIFALLVVAGLGSIVWVRFRGFLLGFPG